MEEEGVTSFQSCYELCLWHVWSVALLLHFQGLQGQRSQHLSGSWATLAGADPIPACSRFPATPAASCPCRAPGVQPSPPHPAGRAKPPLSSPPVLPVALPWALQCLSVCAETLVLCKQKQKDYLYFNPISSEPTNICQTR